MSDKISVIYVEDDEIEVVRFEKLVREFPDIRFLGTFKNAREALDFCAVENPDVAIVDIVLKGNTGIWLAKELNRLSVAFAFLSGYEEYAVQAFDANALHYIVKPVSAIKIRELLARYAKSRNLLRDEKETPGTLFKSKDIPNRIFVNTKKEILILQLHEVVYIEANGAYSIFHLDDNKQLVSAKNLKSFAEQILNNPDFVKIHRSYIINQSHLLSINKKRLAVTFNFKNGMTIKVATFRRDEWMEKFL